MHVCAHRDPLCLLRRLAVGTFDIYPTIDWVAGDEDSIHRAYLAYLKKISESLAEQATGMLEEPCELCAAQARITELEAENAELRFTSAAANLERDFLALLQGEHASIYITYNEHSVNYRRLDEYDVDGADWVNTEEKAQALAENRVWKVQVYPRTPISFNVAAAANLPAAIRAILEAK